MSETSRARARALDAADPLAGLRERFALRDGPVYLDGNSLGRPPAATLERLAELGERWASELVSGWEGWLDLPLRAGDALARHVLGARPGEVVVCDSVSVNLFKLALAAVDRAPGALVSWAGDFPTDRYVVAAVAARAGRRHVVLGEPTADALEAVAGDLALVCLSHVDYRSGAIADLAGLSAAARERGALALWDLSHSAGLLEVDLERSGADLAVGCTYKYLGAGPGSPAFLYVREALHDALANPIPGWFGHAEQFAMGPAYAPRPGAARFLTGTPPVAGLVAVLAGAELVAEAGLDRIAAKSSALTGLLVELADERLAFHGVRVGSPRDPRRRGGHVALLHPRARELCAALVGSGAVLCDFREPDVVRFAPTPLDTRFVDVDEAVERTRALLAAGLDG